MGIKVSPQQIDEAYHILEKMDQFSAILENKRKFNTKNNED